MGAGFDYAKELEGLDFTALKADLAALMTDSQELTPVRTARMLLKAP
jgi:catalase-peroxidase